MKLKDKDYVLTEGAAWIEIGRYAIRIRQTTKKDGVSVAVYQNGKEGNNPVAECYVFDFELEDEPC